MLLSSQLPLTYTGEQVYLCYGAHTNLELLELYGFVLDENPHDKVGLSTESKPHHF